MRKPYFSNQRQTWYAVLGNRQVNLGKDREAAFLRWKELCENPLEDYTKPFLDHYRGSTRDFYAKHLKLFTAHTKGVKNLLPYHLTTLLDQYPGQNYKHNIARCVKQCFKWLAEQGLIKESPFKGFKVPPPVSRGDEVLITEEQWQRQLADASEDLRDILIFLRETGARPKEARTLLASHIHDNVVIFEKENSKGRRVQRVIHLTETARAICLKRLRLTGPLFTRNGKPWTADALSRACKVFPPYYLRHNFVHRAIRNGVDVVTLAGLMGHANLTMIQKVYSHIQACDSHMQAAVIRATA